MRWARTALASFIGGGIGAVAGLHAVGEVCRNGCAGEAVILLSGWPIHLALLLSLGAALWAWHPDVAAGASAAGALAWVAAVAVWPAGTWSLHWPLGAPAMAAAGGTGLLAFWLAATLVAVGTLLATRWTVRRTVGGV